MSQQDEPTAIEAESGNGALSQAEMGVSCPFPSPLQPLSSAGDGSVDGRDPETGRFVSGNTLGLGNPLAMKAHQFRVRLYTTCSPEDLGEVVAELVRKAKAGEPWAVKLLLDRLLGPPVALDVAQRIERLEVLLQGRAT